MVSDIPLTTFACQPDLMFSNQQRSGQLAALSEQKFDLLIVGGGITGVGIALDAASRGFTVALVEKQDFAAGTSSRSTKLVHGGLRYLKQLDFGLVREVGRERAIVHRNAPHIVWPEKMLLPIVEGGSLGKWSTSVALTIYEWLAQVPKADQRIMLGLSDTTEEEPLLQTEGLIGSALYSEYRTDDARLVIEVAKTANQLGAQLINYCEVIEFTKTSGVVDGAKVVDRLSEQEFAISATYVVNAAGPWVDKVRSIDEQPKGKRLSLTKGVHLVFDHERLPLKHSIYFDVGDGRMVFAITRDGSTYVGTTDTNYNGPIERPEVLKKDVGYLLKAANNMLNVPELTTVDIRSSWAGIRPLIYEEGKSASELSRKDEIFESSGGLISIAGGKLTGYRMMAKRTVDLISERNGSKGPSLKPCTSDSLKLSGSDFGSISYLMEELENTGLSKEDSKRLATKFGSNAYEVMKHYATYRNDHRPELALMMAQLAYCVEHEMVAELSDFMIRRTGWLYFDRSLAESNIDALNELLATLLPWTEQQKLQSLDACRKAFAAALEFK